MRLAAFSSALSCLTLLAIGGTAQATAVAPLPPGVAGKTKAANISPVYYHHHWRHHRWHHAYGSYWDYYRVDWPGRGTSEESTR